MGDVVGITGDSGSGKSTLVTLLAGFLTPTNGKLKLIKKIFKKLIWMAKTNKLYSTKYFFN